MKTKVRNARTYEIARCGGVTSVAVTTTTTIRRGELPSGVAKNNQYLFCSGT